MPRKVNYLKEMKINEISLVTDPACPDANVLFTKHRKGGADVLFGKRDVSNEPRDDRGRWSRMANSAKEQMKSVAAYAQRVAHHVIRHSGRVGSAIVSTKPNGARPISGGGVQFEFLHRLSDGGRYHSSVQVRPEHLKALAGTRRTVDQNGHTVHEDVPHFLQNALSRTETILRHTGVGEVSRFGQSPAGPEFGYRSLFRVQQAPASQADREEAEHRQKVQSVRDQLRRTNELRAAAGQAPVSSLFDYRPGSGAPAPAVNSAATREHNDYESNRKQGPFGIPLYRHPPDAGEPSWSRQARGRAPSGSEPLANSNFRDAGGKAHYYRGNLIPNARPDIQAGIAEVHDWLAAQGTDVAARVKDKMREGNVHLGSAFFTHRGDFVPMGDTVFQNQIKEKYRAAREGKPHYADNPIPVHHDYPEDLSGMSDEHLFELRDKAARRGHAEQRDRINNEIVNRTGPRVTRVPTPAREDANLNWSEARKGSGFAPFITSDTKSRARTLERAQRVAKSKIKRD